MPSRAVRTAETKRKTTVYLAIGAVLLIVLLVTLNTAGKEQTMRCERLDTGEVDCTVRQSILGIITVSQKTIAGAQAASLGQQCVDVNCNYRLELFATQGLIPVNEKYTSDYDRQVKIKNLINDFFNDKTRSFVQVTEETNTILILGVVVAFLLVFAYLGYLIWQVQHPKEEE